MKAISKILVFSLVFLLSGCFVKSLHPYYTEKDLVFKKELLGSWMDKDSSTWTIQQHSKITSLFKPNQGTKAYDIEFTTNKGTSHFLTHLFQLNNQLYLDFFPVNVQSGTDFEGQQLVGTHSLAKVILSGGKITIRWYNEEWLIGLFKQNKIRIQHERIPYDPESTDPDQYQVILTANTQELQKFIQKYGNDPASFGDEGKNESFTIVLSRK